MPDQLTTLARRLGVDQASPTPLSPYDAAAVARLDPAVTKAIGEEDRAFEEALTKVFALLPRMLRGTAQKLLGQS